MYEVSAVATGGEIAVLANCKSTKGNKSDFFVFYYKNSTQCYIKCKSDLIQITKSIYLKQFLFSQGKCICRMKEKTDEYKETRDPRSAGQADGNRRSFIHGLS